MAATEGPPVERADNSSGVGELIHRITDDMKYIAGGEVELARAEMAGRVKKAAVDAAMVVLGGVVVLIAIAMASGAIVDALGGSIPELWLRLLLVAIAYAVIGGALVVVGGKLLRKQLPPEAPRAKDEAVRTIEAVKEGLRHA
jgi:hypothetical protein